MKETIEQVTEQAHDAAIATRVQVDEAREALKRRMRRGVGRRQGGATIVEYALLVGLLSVAAITVIVAVGNQVDGLFQEVQEAINTNTEVGDGSG
ncbi:MULTISPECIES: Flp family type IVb pilin [unclassified Halorhodospira]|uniref:Flp family type IVb pilin n=1 Tax=unclassified Halorhodospira TaxID=2626748 RepID=UPI001EE83787|nr:MULTISPECIES: Flp family type IVb pilin [unclassified Halorhodospira]MCG5540411.1 Flp family type IVb pilin [Halorhodospira sp. M39old]MCG5545736.1 Flp family type IVb pilin [Halorhodospira sp. M38]